jgi:hypothetical protein
MNESSQPIPLDNQACIAALEQMLAFHKHVEEQRKKNAATVTTCEPRTVLGHFQSAAADVHRALRTFRGAVQHVVGNELLNNQLAHLLATMERNAENFQTNIEVNIFAISREIDSFSNIKLREPGEDKGGEP